MRPRCWLWLLPALLLLRALPALGQTEPPGTIATTLAAGQLPNVVEMPFFLRLYQVRLPPAAKVWYEGSSALLYALSGDGSVAAHGAPAGETKRLREGGGVFIAAGEIVAIRAFGEQPLDLLLFLLTARPNQRRAVVGRPAAARELFRTPVPLPGLQKGPYRFSLSRVTLPPGGASSAAYSRSGAALDYVLQGRAALIAEGKTETTKAGSPLFERFGWVHRLKNPGAVPLVLLQANVSQEGAPAVQAVAGSSPR